MLGSVSIVTVFGLLVQVIGFIRMAIIAATLGLTGDVDAYYLGLTLPSLLTVVIANWLQLAYLGRYTTLLTQEKADLAHSFKRSVMLFLAGLTLPFVLFWYGLPELTMSLLVEPSVLQPASQALMYLGIMTLPVILADFMGQTLNGHHRFALAAAAPLLNAIVATVALWFWPTKDLNALVASLLLGCTIQFLVVAPSFFRLYRGPAAAPHLARKELLDSLRLSLPLIPAVVVSNAMLSILQFAVSRLGEGSVAVMSYANRINSGISQLMVIGLGTVLLPYFAKLLAGGQQSAIILVFRRLVRGTVIASVLICAALFSLGQPVIELLFSRGRFSAADAEAVSALLFILSLSLLPLSLGSFIARYFSAQRRADLVLWSALIGLIGTLTGVTLGLSLNSVYVIGLAPTACFTLTAVFWFWMLSRKLPAAPIMMDVGTTLIRAAAIVLPLLVLDHVLQTAVGSWMPPAAVGTRGAVFVLLTLFLIILAGTRNWILSPDKSLSKETRE